jgi:hypothetical protein
MAGLISKLPHKRLVKLRSRAVGSPKSLPAPASRAALVVEDTEAQVPAVARPSSYGGRRAHTPLR